MSTEEVKKQTQVSSEVEQQEKLIGALNGFADKLDAQLAEVQRSPETETESGEKIVGPQLVSLALKLAEHNRRINLVNNHLAGILDRLEL